MTLSETTNHQLVFLSVGWVAYGLALLLLSARVYIRFVTTHHPAADDYLMLLTMFTSTAMMVAATFVALFVPGRHFSIITPNDRLTAAYNTAIAFYLLTVALTKAAILLQLGKIFQPFTKRPLYWVCLGLVAFVVFWAVVTVLSSTLKCGTLGIRFLEPRTIESQCSITTWTIQGVLSIILDSIAIMLPLPLVWQLHIPIKQKSFAFAMLAIGSIGCLFTIIRIVSLYTLKPSADTTYNHLRVPLWFILEALIAVCCGALMGSKQLILHWFPSLSPKPDEILPPMQLDTTLLDPENSQSFIKLDNEDMNKLHLESIMYRLAVIGSPWAQVPESTTDAVHAAKPDINTKSASYRHQQRRHPSLTPSRPKPARTSKRYKKHDSLTTQWTE